MSNTAKFIKLTLFPTQKEAYINVSLVASFGKQEEGYSWVSFSEDFFDRVIETPEQIIELINAL